MTIPADTLWPELEKDGEDNVRKKLAQGSYGHNKVRLVEEWLLRKDAERSLRSEEAKKKIALDMLDAAKRQAAAAEAAASSALEQARIARTAKNIAIIAAISGIITLIANIIISACIQ